MKFVGKKVVIVGNSANHRWKNGTVVKILNVYPLNGGGCGYYDGDGGEDIEDEDYQYTAVEGKNRNQQTLYRGDFELFEMDEAGINKFIDDIRKSIEKKEADIKSWQGKLEYMKTTGAKTYKDDEWKAFTMLKTLNDDSTEFEKAQLIAKLIKG